MLIGKLFIGWRDSPAWERDELGLPDGTTRVFALQWGDIRTGWGVVFMVAGAPK